MSGISRIGGLGKVNRDTPSAGLEKMNDPRREALEDKRNEKVYDAAKVYEKYFLGEMMKAMRGTVTFSDVSKPSMGENIYRSELDQQYVETWGDNGGIGLANLIYDQVMERYFAGAGRELKAQGPIAITDRDVTRVQRKNPDSTVNNQTGLRVEVRPAPGEGAAKILAPWNAKVISQNQIDGKSAVTLEHGAGLKSTVIFQGVVGSDLAPGTEVNKGQTIGTLNPDVNSFFWNLNQGQSFPGQKSPEPDAGLELRAENKAKLGPEGTIR